MQVKQVMSRTCEYVTPDTTLSEAAKKMRDLDVGFLPVLGKQEDLQGVLTDRDITIRAIASGKNPEATTVDEVKTGDVLSCFQEDDLAEAAKIMQKQQVYRLVVLDDSQNKKICGVVSLGDFIRTDELKLSAETVKAIAS